MLPVPGIDHPDEVHRWERHGEKVPESLARAAFPQFSDLPYAQ